MLPPLLFLFFFFNDTATTEIYPLSLHDALPICSGPGFPPAYQVCLFSLAEATAENQQISRKILLSGTFASLLALVLSWVISRDRKSTRLNSSHLVISYAVFCLKKKNTPE